MGGMGMGDTEKIEAIAQQQFGVISIRQARDRGIHKMSLLRLLDHDWRRPYPGIYVHPDAQGFASEAQAALLWAGQGAVLSHCAAAKIYRLDGVPDFVM